MTQLLDLPNDLLLEILDCAIPNGAKNLSDTCERIYELTGKFYGNRATAG